MKAIICPKYGPPEVLQLQEVEKPEPGNNELLIRVNTCFVGIDDVIQRKGKPYFGRIFIGLTKPKKPILGTEFCGKIEEIGKDVKLYKKGDRVFGVTDFRFGCNAEYMCMPETGLLSLVPENMTNEEAAPVCGALSAWNHLKAIANIQSGQKVLIYGASGSIGLAAIQIAKLFETEVTGVCSVSDFDKVKSLGADFIVDESKEDVTKNGLIYDVILDVSGKPSSLKFKKSLNKNGFYLTIYPTISILFQNFWTSMFKGKKVVFSATAFKPLSERLSFLNELIKLFKEEKLKIVIDKSYPLEKIIEAHQYIEKGLNKGNIVITI